jgi:hypothetical protein
MRRREPEPEPVEDKPGGFVDYDDGWMGGVPHGGVWTRDDKRDPPVLVCREHDLAPEEH